MAVVYRATQLSLNREVALKLLGTQLGDDPSFRERFKREGQMQAALDHRHIVTVHEAGESELGLFLAMRLIPGPTLKELVLDHQLDPRRTLRLLAQVAQALDTAHEAGLIHRDIKPQNILVDKDDHVYLADFGLTKALDEESSLTAPGQFLGTIDYSAPEQIQGEPATGATDIYALSAVLFECLTGEVPFKASNEAAVLHAHIMKPPPTVTELRPELPATIDDVIARGMAKDPTARPASASELLREATRALSSVPAVASSAQQTRSSDVPAGAARGTQDTRAGGVLSPTVPAGAGAAAEATVAAAPAAKDADTLAGAPRSATHIGGRSWAIVLALGVLAAVAGFLVGNSGGSKKTPKLTNTAAVGHLQVRYPSGWQLASSATSVPGMTVSEPLAIAAGEKGASVTAGEVADGIGPTLLPAAFRSRVHGSLPSAESVRLGTLEAYRYEGVHVRGLSGTLSIYAVPNTGGVATILCISPSAGGRSSFLAECARLAATLRLVGVTPYGLGPSADYAAHLSSVLSRMHNDSSGPLGELARASTPSGQASVEQRLADVFSRAGKALGSLDVPPAAGEAHTAIAASVRRLASAYSHSSAAASSNDSGAYASASRDVGSASTALGRALRALRTLGYTVEG